MNSTPSLHTSGWSVLLLTFSTLAAIEYLLQHLRGLVCSFFASLSCIVAYKIYLIHSGISRYDSMPSLVCKMIEMDKDIEQQLNAVIALEYKIITSDSTKDREVFIKMGGVNPLCKYISSYKDWNEYLMHALPCLHSLIVNNDVSIDVSFISIIIEILNNNNNENIIQYGNMILGILAHNNKDIQDEIIDAGAINVIDNILSTNMKSHIVVSWCLYSILNLSCENDKCKYIIGQIDLLKHVVNAMSIHKESRQIQRMGIITLGYCILTSIDNLKDAMNNGMDEVIIYALKSYKDDKEIQQFGSMLLGRQYINQQNEDEDQQIN